MSTTYLQELDGALVGHGFGGRRRRRIVAEFADHLAEDPGADLGAPTDIARRFADELGTSFARNAALAAFIALAVTGTLLTVRVLTMGPFNNLNGDGPETVAILGCVLAAQVAFAAGTLGLLRAWRLRRAATIARDEATILGRRAAVGLAAGAVTTLVLPLRASMSPHASTSAGWQIAAMAVGLGALMLAAPVVVRAARVRPLAGGPAADLIADLGPAIQRVRLGSPTRFALLFAGTLTVVIAAVGVAGDDPYDGAIRGLLEGGTCLAGYGLLGRYLGLWRRSTGEEAETPLTSA